MERGHFKLKFFNFNIDEFKYKCNCQFCCNPLHLINLSQSLRRWQCFPSSGSYAYGSVVTLTATPASGYQFSSWSGDISSSSQTVNVTLYSNKNVIATFTPIIYTPEPINYNMPGNGILGFSVWWTNYLNAGTEIKGTVSLSGSTPGGIDWSSNWIF